MSALDGVNGTVCDAHQNKQPFADANSSLLTSGQSIGLTVSVLSSAIRLTLSRKQLTIEASLLSFGALIVVFILIVRNVLRYRRALPNGKWKLLRTPTDIYMVLLHVFTARVNPVGGILNFRWAHNGIVTTGPYCTAQGIIKQIGALGVALISLILTVHTFTTALWSVGAEALGISNGIHKDFEVPTPYWCWINPKYHEQRLAGEYVWMWIALFASVVMYIPLHFWMKGYFSVDDKKWYKFRLVKSHVKYPKRRATLGVLLYPLAYTLMVIPLTVSRWLLFSHKHVPSATTFFGLTMFNLSGALNVLIFLIVRPRLLLFIPPEEFGESGMELAKISTNEARTYG
ncbi:hypothetical protein H4582DRAFT_2080561 [Lactarius indigo]|nr:hypothetical protein H4582DRAFT_2080561 [Lactarius indigo]